ncbi:hypothetical protein CYY_003684 [Polysphondylium violaceum]|uniref:Enolase C-terminal domain-containing protein n=1 Tax=Polysphondylium violaceum TaxID=133409 RepID=A0A8J4V5S2_9MYCE|nr:hypothetical protein CYY_003684 [Polysphondylium violaceum]
MSTFRYKKLSISINIRPYRLHLRNPFGTAHSVTTERNNALVTIEIINDENHTLRGYGECGLPPKKPYCYLADFNDIQQYFSQYLQMLKERITDDIVINDYNPFNSLPSNLFKHLRSTLDYSSDEYNQLFYFLFQCLDQCKENEKDYSFASRSLIEMALLDAWSKYFKQPIYKFANLPEPSLKPFYYTISLCPTMKEILDSTEFGVKYTGYLKIKLDSDVAKCKNIIDTVINFIQNDLKKTIYKLSVDANSSWTPQVAKEYLSVLEPIKHMISMVEQPFPIETTKVSGNDKEIQEWREIKQLYQDKGIPLFADESVCTEKDLPLLVDLVHGVNVKLEKTGGFRSAVSTVLQAQELGLKTWIGCMVASSLNVSTAAHILTCLSEYGGDLDGGLLIDDETQLFENDGFQVDDNGLIHMTQSNYGIGVTYKLNK